MNDGRVVVAAAIENEFRYKKCCGDESGILQTIELIFKDISQISFEFHCAESSNL